MKIEIVISKDGSETTLHVEGVKGKACKDLTRSLERALGRVTRQTTTREYLEAPPAQRRGVAG